MSVIDTVESPNAVASAVAKVARATSSAIRMTTRSGSVYVLAPVRDSKTWAGLRLGSDGSRAEVLGTISMLGDQLVIGQWETTGLERIELV